MTLLDLIRKLHSDGVVVGSVSLFAVNDFVLDFEDAIRSAYPNDPSYIPPASLELGDDPKYIVCKNAAEYNKATTCRIVKAIFPVLVVGLYPEKNQDFLNKYRGCMWSDIPPVELRWTEAYMENALPALDRNGRFLFFTYMGETPDGPASYYTLRSDHGTEFAWQGDIMKDQIPAGLTLKNSDSDWE